MTYDLSKHAGEEFNFAVASTESLLSSLIENILMCILYVTGRVKKTTSNLVTGQRACSIVSCLSAITPNQSDLQTQRW